eukprot:3042957-Rhodomonas_salina.1
MSDGGTALQKKSKNGNVGNRGILTPSWYHHTPTSVPDGYKDTRRQYEDGCGDTRREFEQSSSGREG